jgi:hypothetical protein
MMNALKQRLDTKPADPVGFPTGRTIAPLGPNSRPSVPQPDIWLLWSSARELDRPVLPQWRAYPHRGVRSHDAQDRDVPDPAAAANGLEVPFACLLPIRSRMWERNLRVRKDCNGVRDQFVGG